MNKDLSTIKLFYCRHQDSQDDSMIMMGDAIINHLIYQNNQQETKRFRCKILSILSQTIFYST